MHCIQCNETLSIQSGNLLLVLMYVSLFDGLLACLWLGRCIKCMHTAYKERIGQCRTRTKLPTYKCLLPTTTSPHLTPHTVISRLRCWSQQITYSVCRFMLSVCACVYVCAWMCVLVYVCMFVSVRVHACVCVHVCVCACTTYQSINTQLNIRIEYWLIDWSLLCFPAYTFICTLLNRLLNRPVE